MNGPVERSASIKFMMNGVVLSVASEGETHLGGGSGCDSRQLRRCAGTSGGII